MSDDLKISRITLRFSIYLIAMTVAAIGSLLAPFFFPLNIAPMALFLGVLWIAALSLNLEVWTEW